MRWPAGCRTRCGRWVRTRQNKGRRPSRPLPAAIPSNSRPAAPPIPVTGWCPTSCNMSRSTATTDPAQLGILVNTQQVNPKPFIYLVYTTYTDVQIQDLVPSWAAGTTCMPNCSTPIILLLIDPPPEYARRPEVRETLERLLGTEDDTFHRAYDLAQTYPLPSGSRVLLYERRFPRLESADLGSHQALMADLNKAALPGDAILAAPPEAGLCPGKLCRSVRPALPAPVRAGAPPPRRTWTAWPAWPGSTAVCGWSRASRGKRSQRPAGRLAGRQRLPGRPDVVRSTPAVPVRAGACLHLWRRHRWAGVHPAPDQAGVERPDRPARLLFRRRNPVARPDRPYRPAVAGRSSRSRTGTRCLSTC